MTNDHKQTISIHLTFCSEFWLTTHFILGHLAFDEIQHRVRDYNVYSIIFQFNVTNVSEYQKKNGKKNKLTHEWDIWSRAYLLSTTLPLLPIHRQMMFKPSILTMSCLNYHFVLIFFFNMYIRLRCVMPNSMKPDRKSQWQNKKTIETMIEKRKIKHKNMWMK